MNQWNMHSKTGGIQETGDWLRCQHSVSECLTQILSLLLISLSFCPREAKDDDSNSSILLPRERSGLNLVSSFCLGHDLLWQTFRERILALSLSISLSSLIVALFFLLHVYLPLNKIYYLKTAKAILR